MNDRHEEIDDPLHAIVGTGQPPVIAPGHTFSTVTDKISSIVLTRKTSLGWYAGFGFSFLLTLMLLASVTGALVVWAVVRFILRENLLAYPLAVALALLLGSAVTLLQNQRSDLIVNAVVEIVAAIALAVWIAYPTHSEPQHV